MNNKSSLFIIDLNRIDVLTLSSVFTTFFAIIFAINEHVYLSMALLFVAMTADALDGMLARKYGLEREFGRYLDGFMDMLIYLVTPAIIMLQWGFDGYYCVFIMLMIGAGSVRLSVFNQVGNVESTAEDGKQNLSYLGMPVFWSVFILAGAMIIEKIFDQSFSHNVLAIMLLAFSFYMVVSKPFFKFRSLKQILSLTIGGFVMFAWFEFEQFSQYSPLTFILLALYLQIPVVIGGVLHMMVVTRNDFSFLAKPIHTQWFGANKTWRGVIAVPVLTSFGGLCLYPLAWMSEWLFGHALLSGNFLWLGFVAGVGYILGELPNSFVKRRMGIQAGQVPEDKKYWFIALDQLDSAIGVAIGCWLVFGIATEVVWLYIITFPVTALLVKQWLYSRNLKASAV
ncbi:MAG: CDP-diacylglycerol--serine O-phosphatidyltransferase [Bermanella sp.]|jgi:CDP-diacylglycerol--serine O-phosphatidyltransferase